MVGGKWLTYTWLYDSHDWVTDNGVNKFNEWIEKAAKQASINSLIR